MLTNQERIPLSASRAKETNENINPPIIADTSVFDSSDKQGVINHCYFIKNHLVARDLQVILQIALITKSKFHF